MNEIDSLIDQLGKVSKLTHIKDKIREKQDQINSIKAKKCGNCFHWMKRSCKPEKVYKQFKSVSSPACDDFEFNGQQFLETYERELSELKLRYKDSV